MCERIFKIVKENIRNKQCTVRFMMRLRRFVSDAKLLEALFLEVNMSNCKLLSIALLGFIAIFCFGMAMHLQVEAPWATVLMVGDFGVAVLGIIAIAI